MWEQFTKAAADGGDIDTLFVQVTNPGQTLPNLNHLFNDKQGMKDKFLIVGVGTERLWRKLCALLGVEDTLMVDERFATNPARNVHRLELVSLLEELLRGRTASEWVDQLVAAGIPAGPSNFPDEILEDDHVKAREMIGEIDHPVIGVVRSVGNPIKMGEFGPTYRRHPPRLGEHNREIRRELG